MESYVDVSKDNGGYDELTFIVKDAEDCLYTSHMHPQAYSMTLIKMKI